MKLGVNTLIWSAAYNNSVEEVLPTIKEEGFDGIEFPIFRAADVSPTRIRSAMELNDLECNTVSIFVDGLNAISDDATIRKRSIQWLKDAVAITAECGADTIAGPLYCPVGYLPGRRRTADEWSWAIEAYQQVGDTLTEHNVSLAIEPLNRFETYFLNTAEDAALLAEEVGHPKVGILYDTFHANIEEKSIGAGLLKIGKYLKLIHMCENDRGIPGSGHVEWESVFNAIRQLEYNGWLTIESFGFALGDLSAAAAIWRDIESSPSAIAYEGVRFLRKAAGMDHESSGKTSGKRI
ncbi:MAG TPA: sugar phosphate isomerase/epimerase family protein [Edaphobacter sp.]|nr:sugar phosphate isomerase/epimerase family protein [Edaphobacter sp.]